VNTNPLYTPREMEHQFKDSGAAAIIIVANFAKNLEEIIGRLPDAKHVIVTNMGDMLGALKGALVNFVVKSVKKMVPDFSLPNAIYFKTAMNKGKSLKLDKPALDPEDLAVLQYTGGTTGISKGAQLSHRNLITHTQMITEWFGPYMTDDGSDIIITAIPM